MAASMLMAFSGLPLPMMPTREDTPFLLPFFFLPSALSGGVPGAFSSGVKMTSPERSVCESWFTRSTCLLLRSQCMTTLLPPTQGTVSSLMILRSLCSCLWCVFAKTMMVCFFWTFIDAARSRAIPVSFVGGGSGDALSLSVLFAPGDWLSRRRAFRSLPEEFMMRLMSRVTWLASMAFFSSSSDSESSSDSLS
jgi:hypothetical protein